MSWLFSAALVEAHSRATCSETPSSAQLNAMPTPQPFWRNDKTMEPSRFSRFGLTCEVLKVPRGEALLTWFREAFLARTSASLATETASMASAADSGTRWRASFARWNPESFGWKTAQCSLLEDSPESLATLPRWGSMRNGMLYLRQTLTHGTLATPKFHEWQQQHSPRSPQSLSDAARSVQAPSHMARQDETKGVSE
jgi:hypothetical protein